MMIELSHFADTKAATVPCSRAVAAIYFSAMCGAQFTSAYVFTALPTTHATKGTATITLI
jgi:hypothetical protein